MIDTEIWGFLLLGFSLLCLGTWPALLRVCSIQEDVATFRRRRKRRAKDKGHIDFIVRLPPYQSCESHSRPVYGPELADSDHNYHNCIDHVDTEDDDDADQGCFNFYCRCRCYECGNYFFELEQRRNVGHVFMDYATAYLVVSSVPLLMAILLSEEMLWEDDQDSGTRHKRGHAKTPWGHPMPWELMVVAMLGGALLSGGNLALQWATSVYGSPMTTVMGIEASLTVLLGTSINYFLEPSKTPRPWFLVGGVLVFFMAIILATKSQVVYARLMRQQEREDTMKVGRELELNHHTRAPRLSPPGMRLPARMTLIDAMSSSESEWSDGDRFRGISRAGSSVNKSGLRSTSTLAGPAGAADEEDHCDPSALNAEAATLRTSQSPTSAPPNEVVAELPSHPDAPEVIKYESSDVISPEFIVRSPSANIELMAKASNIFVHPSAKEAISLSQYPARKYCEYLDPDDDIIDGSAFEPSQNRLPAHFRPPSSRQSPIPEIPPSTSAEARQQRYMGVWIAVLGGLCFGFFSPCFNIAANDPFQWTVVASTLSASDTMVTVARANWWFSFAFWVASFAGNIVLLQKQHKFETEESISVVQVLYTYITQDGILDRQLALTAGIVCALGNILQFQGGQMVGYATADLVQAYPLVATVWDVLLFGEFRSVPTGSWLMITLIGMYLAYFSGIVLLSVSSLTL